MDQQIPALDWTHFKQVTRSSPSFSSLNCDLKNGKNYREQLNLVTSFLDASHVYGNTRVKSDQLRLMSNGFLKTTPGLSSQKDYLPTIFYLNEDTKNPMSDQCSKTNKSISCFVTGDTRASENLGLASVHTLFVREHNRIASQLAVFNPSWSDELLFHEARRILIGIYQHIIYKEWVKELIA